MRRAFSSCRLYSWMRLTWLSKIESGSTRHAGRRFEPFGEMRLGLALGLADGVAEAGVVGQRLRASHSSGKVGDPAVADRLGDACGERRVGQQQPAPRRHAVGLVVEALGKHVGQVLDRHRAQQPEWIAATPLVLCEPTMASWPCGSCARRPPRRGSCAPTRPSSPGKRARTSSRGGG